MASRLPKPKVWEYPRLLSEHAYDKLWTLDCSFGEFDAALEHAVVIEERPLTQSSRKELVLTVEWTHPLHVVVVVDQIREEERILTVYQPNPGLWSPDYRRRR
jgi:hypothetical protein